VCPLGVVTAGIKEDIDEPPEPGTFLLDRGLEQLRWALPANKKVTRPTPS
jgi:hypothetical protein